MNELIKAWAVGLPESKAWLVFWVVAPFGVLIVTGIIEKVVGGE